MSGFTTFPSSVASLTSSGLTMESPFNNAAPWPNLQYQQQQPLFTSTVGQPTIQQYTQPVGGALNNQVCLIKKLYQMFCQLIQM